MQLSFRHILTVYGICLLSTIVAAQSTDLAKLQALLGNSRTDTGSVRVMIQLSDHFTENDSDTALYYAKSALEKSKQIDWLQGEAEACYQTGLIYREKNDLVQAKVYLRMALNGFTATTDHSGAANSLRRLAFIANQEGDYDLAERYYKTALSEVDLVKNEELKAKILSGISGLYRLKGEYDLSVSFGLKAMRIQEKLNDLEGLPFTMDRLGVVFKLQEDYPKALYYYQKSYEIRRANKASKLKDLGYSCMVIGETYIAMDSLDAAVFKLEEAKKHYTKANNLEGLAYAQNQLADIHIRKGNFDLALHQLKEAISIFQEIGNPRGRLNSLYSLTLLFLSQKKQVRALPYASEFYEIADQIGSQNHRTNARFFMYQIALAQKDYKKALHFHEQYLAVKDSLWNETKGAEIARLESRNSLDIKESENRLLSHQKTLTEEKLKQQRYLIVALLGCILFILVGISLLIHMNRAKKRHVEELETKNKSIEEQQCALKIAEEHLRAMNENLEEIVLLRTDELRRSNAKLERFADLASHDLKQPLRTIRGFTQLLERDLQKKGLINDRLEEYLQYITGGVSYMNQLIDNILRFGKYANSDGNIFVDVNLKDVMVQVQQNLRLQIQASRAEIVIEVPEITIKAVRIKIEQLFQNLLSNAIKYREIDRPLRIAIQVEEQNDMVQIRFTDNGKGILETDQKMLFKIFNAGSREKQSSPKGIGLTICKKIAEQHGGEIWVTSKQNEGSTFHVTLSKTVNQHQNEAAA